MGRLKKRRPFADNLLPDDFDDVPDQDARILESIRNSGSISIEDYTSGKDEPKPRDH